jgi:hypothetical protein
VYHTKTFEFGKFPKNIHTNCKNSMVWNVVGRVSLGLASTYDKESFWLVLTDEDDMVLNAQIENSLECDYKKVIDNTGDILTQDWIYKMGFYY